MSATPTTMTELNDLAKDYYSDVYVNLSNPDTPLRDMFMKLENAIFTGRKWIFKVKTEIGAGSSNAGANKTLPAAAAGTYDEGEAFIARQYTRMAIDNLLIEVTKKREGSAAPALAELMEDRLQRHDLETNRQMFCRGDGRLALVTPTGASSATQTLINDYGVTNGGNGTRHVVPGATIAFYDGVTLIGRRVVNSVDYDAGTIVVDSTIDTTSKTDPFITLSTADDDNFTAGEINGLLRAADDDTFEGIPGTGRWAGNILTNPAGAGTLRQLTDELVVTAIAIHRAKSRTTPDLAVCQPGVTLKYSLLFLPLRRIDGQDGQLKGGFKPVNELIAGGNTRIPVLEDLDCPDARLFIVAKKAFRMADLIGSDWADLDGAQFSRITDKDAIEGYIRSYRQLITVQRNAVTVIEDLESVAGINRLAA